MSRVHDRAILLPSSSGDSRFLYAENAVRADDGAMRGHVARHDRIRADGGTAANAHRAEHLCARADEDVIFNYCKIAALFPGHDGVLSAYGHLVHHRNPAAELHAALDHYPEGQRHQARRAEGALEPGVEQQAHQTADAGHLQQACGQRIRAHHGVRIAPLDAAFEPAQDRALDLRQHRGQRLIVTHHHHVRLVELDGTVEHHAEIAAACLTGRVLEHAQRERREATLDVHHQARALRAVTAGEKHVRPARLEPSSRAEPMQAAAQLRETCAGGESVAGTARRRDEPRGRLLPPEVPDAIERALRVFAPQRRKPDGALIAEHASLHRVDQAADEQRVCTRALLGGDEEARAHETRAPDFIGPGEHRAPGAALQARELHQAEVEVLREARHEARQRPERRAGNRDIELLGRGLGKAARVADQAERDAVRAQALEQRLGDVAALFHQVWLNTVEGWLKTVTTGWAAQRVRRRRSRESPAASSPGRTTIRAPPASAANISRSGPRSAAGVSISTTRNGRAAACRKWRRRLRLRSSSGSSRTRRATSTARFSRHAARRTPRPSSRSASPPVFFSEYLW